MNNILTINNVPSGLFNNLPYTLYGGYSNKITINSNFDVTDIDVNLTSYNNLWGKYE